MSIFKRKKHPVVAQSLQYPPACPSCNSVGNILQDIAFAGSNTDIFICDTPHCEVSHYSCDTSTGEVTTHIPDSSPSYTPSTYDSGSSYSNSDSGSSYSGGDSGGGMC